MTRIFIGVFLILLGISALTGVAFFKFFFAFLLIFIGIRIMVGRKMSWHHSNKKETIHTTTTTEDTLNEVVILSGVSKATKSSAFKGGKVVAIFSGAEIDLSQATTEVKEITLELVAIFAGIKLIVPKTWSVVLESTAIAGGYDNNVSTSTGDVILRIKGAAILGGVEITTA